MTPTCHSLYLDNNATTRPLPEVCEVIDRISRDAFANPGSRHAAGRAARRVLEASRETIAGVLDAEPDEVIFTSGGTESINLALFGLARGTGTIATGPGEHPATTESVAALLQRGWRHHVLPIDASGRLRALSEPPGLPEPGEATGALRLVSLLLAHNETGVLQDPLPLIERCNAAGVPTHLDAVQAVGKLPISFKALGATALSFGAHKFHGPRGIGGLLLRRGATLSPLFYGGHQESGRRPGTEPIALIAGMAKALELWHRDASLRIEQMRAARDRLESALAAACPPIIVHGKDAPRLPNTANLAFPGLNGEALLVALDLEGVACSLGSTCASGSAEPAPILLAMGIPPEVALATVRFSVSFETTFEEIDEAAQRIATVVRRLRAL
jgi:cysteine desulfurase